MDPFFVFDLHSDILTDVVFRRARGETEVIVRRHLPGMLAGGLGGACLALWVEPVHARRGFARAWELLNALACELNESREELALVTSIGEFQAARARGRFPFLLGLEGLGFLGKRSEYLNLFQRSGARLAALTWNERNRLATGTLSEEGSGLTPMGRALLESMSRLKVILDLSHLNERSFWEVLESHDGYVLASHSNARALCDVRRNLSDPQLRAVAERGGLIGVNACPEFLAPGPATVDHYIDHVVHIGSVAGIDRVAFGFDFIWYLPAGLTQPSAHQKTDSRRPVPLGLEDATRVPNLLEGMARRGFTDREIAMVAHANVEEFLGAALAEKGG